MTDHSFTDVSGATAPGEPDYWTPVIFRAAEIEAETARLAALPVPANGRRSSVFTHPRSPAASPSLAPGIRVSLDVLLPGERTSPVRHTSTMVGFCIGGEGRVTIGDRVHDVTQYDTWNHPSWRPYVYENTGSEPFVRLTYSNAPLLERMNVHLVQDLDALPDAAPADDEAGEEEHDARRTSPYGTFELEDGAMLMPYETLVNPPSLPSPALHWRWAAVKEWSVTAGLPELDG